MAHPAEPAASSIRRRGRVVEGYARPPAAGHADAPGRARGLALPARLLRAGRHRSRTPRRSPTSTRTSSARASTPARASTTSTRSSAALAGRVPENALLSHDLFEGLFARAGLVTDVELFEELPGALRRRGRAPAPLGARRLAAPAVDPRVAPDATGRPRPDPLPIGRWKMLDNLRRTLSAPAAARDPGRRLDRCPARRPLLWTRVRAGDDRSCPGAPAVLAGLDPAAAGASRSAATCGRSARDLALGPAAGRARGRRCSRTRPGSWATRSCGRSSAST